MNYDNATIPLIDSPALLDAAIQELQIKLSTDLAWLETAYGLASNAQETDINGKRVTLPEVYAGEGQYVKVQPNNFFRSMCFFTCDSKASVVKSNSYANDSFTQDASIVFWLDLDKVSEYMGYTYTHRYTQMLISDVLKALKNQFVFTVTDIETDVASVWQGWTLNLADTQTFKHPETGFKISGKISYRHKC
jgi:hypothetical protein